MNEVIKLILIYPIIYISIMGKKRDPVDIKYDAIDADMKRMFKAIMRNAKASADKKHDEMMRQITEARKADRESYDEATDNLLMAVNGVFQQARYCEKMTDPVIKDLEEKADLWERRAVSMNDEIKKLRDDNRALRKECEELRSFNRTLLGEWGRGGEDAPDGYFCDE